MIVMISYCLVPVVNELPGWVTEGLSIDIGCGQGGLVQVGKVHMIQGLLSRDPLGRVIDQHFLKNKLHFIFPSVILKDKTIVQCCN